jgi:hypothetical protein
LHQLSPAIATVVYRLQSNCRQPALWTLMQILHVFVQKRLLIKL